MTRSRIRYIGTWVALAILITGSVMLLVLSWNSRFPDPPSPALMIMTWALMVAAGIFLFMLAVKKAHRLWIDESRSREARKSEEEKQQLTGKKKKSADPQKLDINASARKLLRRVPDGASLEEAGKMLLQLLAGELEIMSGIFYVKKKDTFRAVSTYAIVSTGEPYSFREGEGLSGQVARNQHVMVLTRLPEGHLEVYSGLGKAKPAYLAMVPLVRRNRTVAVLECSGYRYEPQDIENMFRILSRDLMQKL